jgi:hypothetical protein
MYIMNKTMRAARPYEAPEAEMIPVSMEGSFLFGSITGSSNGRKAAEDLGDTDTDAGNAIWN